MSVELIDTDGGICVHVPMAIKRRSGRKEVIVPDGIGRLVDASPDYHESLVIAISRAHCWLRLLQSGKYRSINELAGMLKVNNVYMRRLIRFTLLSPDIVEAVMNGREPSGFSQNMLMGAVPESWRRQRDLYGFTETTQRHYSAHKVKDVL